MASEGYVLHSYGSLEYLHHAVASVVTLRRFDRKRPVALYASKKHLEELGERGLRPIFNRIEVLPEEHQSIVGFKHNLHRFSPFDRSLFTDADAIWCRNPDSLWQQLRPYRFTATGLQSADMFFGAAKDASIIVDVLLNRRQRTLRRFGLTHLPRVQAGLIYAADEELTRSICTQASEFLDRRDETHFHSRLDEGRSEETCEWSLAVAMARQQLPVLPWLQGYNSPQLDFIDSLTNYDLNFRHVTCRLYCNSFVYSLRGIQTEWLQDALISTFTRLPGRGDFLEVTPFVLHFGWLHQKEPFRDFAARTWRRLVRSARSTSLETTRK